MQKLSLAAALTVMLGACSEPESVVVSEDDMQSGFDTEDERVVYALGVALGESVSENLSIFSLTEAEQDLVLSGIRDALRDSPYQVDMEVYGPMIQGLADDRMAAAAEDQAAAAEEEQAASAEFGAEIAAEPGAEQMASGLIYVPVTAGDGAMPAATDTVRVHYVGTLRDGTVFDSSRDRGEPAEFRLNQVIPCWTEGVQMMQVGETAQLYCPSDIAYGDSGSPPVIPGGASLLFEVELLDIVE